VCWGQPAPRSEPSRFEVGALVSVLEIKDANGLTDLFPRTEVGVGGRFTYNLKSYLAVEAELNFFPRDFHKFTTNFTGGSMLEGLAGVKAGLRKKKFGVFGKFRPGFESSGGAAVPRFLNGNGPDPQNPFGFGRIRSTQFAMDVGGVFEFYPSPRTILRFDGGDTIVRYPGVEFIQFPQGTRILATIYSHTPNSAWASGFVSSSQMADRKGRNAKQNDKRAGGDRCCYIIFLDSLNDPRAVHERSAWSGPPPNSD
jgi:hypothetical protein